MNAIVITEGSKNTDPNNYVQNSAIAKVLFEKKFELFSKDFSHKTSLIATCYTWAKVENRTLT